MLNRKTLFMKKISTTEKLVTYGESSLIRSEIFNKLTDTELFSLDRYELCYHTLKHFDFPSLDLNDKTSIESACEIVLGLIGLNKNPLEELGFTEDDRLLDPINRYMHYFLEMDKLPGQEKKRLESTVALDLKEIRLIIKEYESNNPFLTNGERARNHKQRTIKDYYDRCIDEETKIADYLLDGIRDRAINNAHRDAEWFNSSMFGFLYDKPYNLPFLKDFFKHENINTVSHRVGSLPIQEANQLKALYNQDKKAFYDQVESKVSWDTLVRFLKSVIRWVPGIHPRRIQIFDELTELFDEKKFASFYALGIPQIEGIFTEMCKLCIPNFNHPYDALPDKVAAVRPFYLHSYSILDYFQYYLPNQRNSFLHSGIANEDMELSSKDLLYDLVEVFQIYLSLNTPSIWLNQLLKKRDQTEFSSIKGFVFYFRLLNQVKEMKQTHYFQETIEEMNQHFFPNILENLAIIIDQRLVELEDQITSNFEIRTEKLTLPFYLNKSPNKTLSINKVIIKKELSAIINYDMKDEMHEALEALKFFNQYSKCLDLNQVAPETVKLLEAISAKYSKFLTRIKLITVFTDFENEK